MSEQRLLETVEDESETEWVNALRAGDEGAWDRVVRGYGGRMLAATRRLLGNEEEARDAVQAAFLQAFRGLDRFRGNASMATWLHRIALNEALMRLRSRRCRPETPIDDLLPHFLESGAHAEQVSPWPSPERALRRDEVRTAVRDAIDRLPSGYRDVLRLRDLEELDTEEIAATLDLTPNAVRIRLHRARQALRTLLAPMMELSSQAPAWNPAPMRSRRDARACEELRHWPE